MSDLQITVCVEENEFSLSIPLHYHTGTSLRNLINLFYSRELLINKSLGTNFFVDKKFVEYLQNDSCTYSTSNFLAFKNKYERDHRNGIAGFEITEESLIFKGFPHPENPDYIHSCIQFLDCINHQVLRQKHVVLRKVNSDNEKYSMRIWLIRIGMKGNKYKLTRKILMKNLNGFSSYKTREQDMIARERHKIRRKSYRNYKATN